MNPYHTLHLTSVSELRSAAANWDDLWWRSDVTLPTLRAELIAGWLDQFAPPNDFHAIVVEENGRWLAALPLISQRLKRFLSVGSMTSNPWFRCGDLLLDSHIESEAVLSTLLSAAGDLPWPILWLNDAILDAPRWESLRNVCQQEGVPVVEHARYAVAKIEVARTWDVFVKNLSRNHRKKMHKAERRLQELGDLRLVMHSQLTPDEIPDALNKVFDVENTSWKGSSGSSVLRSPGMSEFFLRQARHLTHWGQLEIALLELNGRPIASLCGFSAKGVYHAHKIGYDPQYGEYSPGQVMKWKVYEQLHNQGVWKAIDCMGPLTEATSHWHPNTYIIGRLAIAPRKLLGRIALQAYRHIWPKIRAFRDGSSTPKKTREPHYLVPSDTLFDDKAVSESCN